MSDENKLFGLGVTDKDMDFPTKYWGEVTKTEYKPQGTQKSQYKNPTMILTVHAIKPTYKNDQLIFLPVPVDDKGQPSKDVDKKTYTGAFLLQMQKLGWTPTQRCNDVVDVLTQLRGFKGHFIRTQAGEKTKTPKWIVDHVGFPETSD